MSVNFDLTGKTAVITGGAGILCSVMARELAQKGVKVAVLDYFGDKAEALAAEIVAAGGCAIGCGADVLVPDSLKKARDLVVAQFGNVDILINGAGGNKNEATTSPENSFFDLSLENLQWVFDLNVMGAVLSTQVFGELMVKTGRDVSSIFPPWRPIIP